MAGKDLSPHEKLALIKDQLQEVLHEDILEHVILKEQRPLIIYWGTATTGRPHCGYFVPMMKIAHFLRAGCRVKILLADIHGFLDNLKAPIELVKFRAEYYKYIIQSLLKAVGVSLEKLEFVLGSSYQLSADYTMDIFRLSSVVTEHDAKKAGAEVVKQVENATLSGLIYPLMQALDEQHLGVDAQFGGVDQRKIFALAQETLPKIGYKERAHLMNPMVPGLAGGKMSASDPDSKIDILDTADAVKKKLRKAYAAAGEIEGNGIISFVEYVLLPISALRDPEGKGTFVCERREGEGEPLVYHDIESLKEDYRTDKLTPQLLKAGASAALVELLAPIQAEFQASPEWQEIEKKAYPPPEPVKKKKQPKDRGSRFPGAANVTAKPDGSIEGEGKERVEVGKTAEQAMSNLDINGQAS
ncbi:tyrosine-tRNA ligase [Fonsecaea erecta]|uniref:Tyrosine--tRNA ligase n=1 Tax=Fonsecaea erecta TaxID=1367422 RepID=A0A178ZB74_9EURO|nr:tyrosine-tRNA ligase [Fonsecaea erecta]OAP56335.1 tyrosine-tRNA ligase [Fonsecaea erecta]